MFTLLNPAALLALLGLLVPIAIHLWNRRPGREVAVGSLRWLAAGANRRLRSLKPEQLWLLLLRTALLAVLALAVAKPVWRQPQPASRGVVLLSPEVLGTPAFAALRPNIDSLRRRGYALRWLAPGFPGVSGVAWRADSVGQRDTARILAEAGRGANRWLWARVQQAAGTFRGQPLYIVTPAALPGFEGTHSPLPLNITWQTLAQPNPATWLAAANLVGDSLHLLVGQSSEIQTTFRREKVLKPHADQLIRVAGMPPLRVQPRAGGGESLVLIPANAMPGSGSDATVSVGALPLVIEIYSTPEYAADARCLEAAVRAAAIGLAIPPLLRRVKVRPTHLSSGWTFWLSDEPLPLTWQKDVRNNARVWQEAVGPGVADTTRLATSSAAVAPVTVFRRGTGPSPKTAVPLWSDGQGRPILTRQSLGHGAVFHLATRLNSEWSELATDPELPARMLALLQPEATDRVGSATAFDQTMANHDQRALDPLQLITANTPHNQATAPTPAVPPAFRFTDLRPWLVLAAGLLFLLERLLARKREARTLFSTES